MKYTQKWRLSDKELLKNLPLGVNLVHTLRGDKDFSGRITWSPDGRTLGAPLNNRTVQLWDVKTGRRLNILKGYSSNINCIAFNPTCQVLASGCEDGTIWLHDIITNSCLIIKGHTGSVNCISFDSTGHRLASGGYDNLVNIWNLNKNLNEGELVGEISFEGAVSCLAFNPKYRILAAGDTSGEIKFWDLESDQLLHTCKNNYDSIYCLDFNPDGETLVAGGTAINLLKTDNGQLIRVYEGHTDIVDAVSFSHTGQIIASKQYYDPSIRLWNVDTGACLMVIREVPFIENTGGLTFSPHLPFLASVGFDTDMERRYIDRVIHIFELDNTFLLSQFTEPSTHYVNAKVVLVGDTGVGKTGLSLVLNNHPFEATDSTPGRRVWTFDSKEVKVSGNIEQTRETMLWDLAGQPGYRIIHQLHLNEVAVALVVFDARSETDPLAGVRHWERALRLAQQRQGTSGIFMKKFLVSARNDRGGISISEDRLQAVLQDFGFDGYFKTSAKEGWQIKELRAAIENAISWENLPEVSSSKLFADIKLFLLDIKKTGQLLAPASQLYNEFAHKYPNMAENVANLREQFDMCIVLLENRDLIRRLTFGGYILLQPEMLDAYASAMVIAAKEEPEGFGSLAEQVALNGMFFVPKEQKILDPGQEQLLLYATVEELVRHDLALRENADDGRYLVFPSQFNRDYEDAPEPKQKAVSITFDGPIQSLYSTLAVRLSHSGLFTTGRAEMWRNAAVFAAKAGGKCGLLLHEFKEARGRLIIFYDDQVSQETRFHFEEFVLAHTKRRALNGTVEFVRFFVCPKCGDPVPDNYVKRLKDKRKMAFNCPCGGKVSLAEPKEQIRFHSKVEAMEKSADHYRDVDAFVISAKGETRTTSFQEWAGGERVTLAIVFTDIVGSTALGEEIRDESMNKVRRAHFAQSRKLIDIYKGREIKTIGDSFMAAFKSSDIALDYAMALQSDTGHPKIQIRAGIHIGPMNVEENDVFGGTVNFAARVIGAIKGAEIWLSDRAKEDIDRLGSTRHNRLDWKQHDDVSMKGFPDVFMLWSVQRPLG